MNNLLMIDHSALEHLVMQKMLQRYDLFKDPAHVFDGRVIIDYLQENRSSAEHLPDLIFLDLNMPEFSGWDFMDQLASYYPSFPKAVAVYILSSSVDEDDRARAEAYPFVRGFYSKPMLRAQLESLYLEYLETHRLAG